MAGAERDDTSGPTYLVLDVAAIPASPWLTWWRKPANSGVIRASASGGFLDPSAGTRWRKRWWDSRAGKFNAVNQKRDGKGPAPPFAFGARLTIDASARVFRLAPTSFLTDQPDSRSRVPQLSTPAGTRPTLKPIDW